MVSLERGKIHFLVKMGFETVFLQKLSLFCNNSNSSYEFGCILSQFLMLQLAISVDTHCLFSHFLVFFSSIMLGKYSFI